MRAGDKCASSVSLGGADLLMSVPPSYEVTGD